MDRVFSHLPPFQHSHSLYVKQTKHESGKCTALAGEKAGRLHISVLEEMFFNKNALISGDVCIPLPTSLTLRQKKKKEKKIFALKRATLHFFTGSLWIALESHDIGNFNASVR